MNDLEETIGTTTVAVLLCFAFGFMVIAGFLALSFAVAGILIFTVVYGYFHLPKHLEEKANERTHAMYNKVTMS